MKGYLLIGLGNPGPNYVLTRHNAGFCVLDAFVGLFTPEEQKVTSSYSYSKHRIDDVVFYCIKPLTYMNLSGNILNDVKRRTGLSTSDMIVICDNMDLPLGRLRLKQGGGSAGQKGLQDIITKAGTAGFARLYVGVGRPAPHFDVASHVLSRFMPEEEEIFIATCQLAASNLALLSKQELVLVQSKIN